MKIGWHLNSIVHRNQILSSTLGYIPNRFIPVPSHPYTEYDVSLKRIRDAYKALAMKGCKIVREGYFMTPKMQHVVWNSDPAQSPDFSRVTDWESCKLALELCREYGMIMSICIQPQGKPEFGCGEYKWYFSPNTYVPQNADPGVGKRTWYEETPAGTFTHNGYKCKAYYHWMDTVWLPWLSHLCHFLSDYADVVWLEPSNEGEDWLGYSNLDDWQPRSYDLVKSINPNLQYGLPDYPLGQQASLGANCGPAANTNQFDALISVGRQDAFDKWAPMHFYPAVNDPDALDAPSLTDIASQITAWKNKLASMGRSDVKLLVNELSDVSSPEYVDWDSRCSTVTALKDFMIAQGVDGLCFFFAWGSTNTSICELPFYLIDNPSTCPEAGQGYWYVFNMDSWSPVFEYDGEGLYTTPIYNTLSSWGLPNAAPREAVVSIAFEQFNQVVIDWPVSATLKKYRVDGGAWLDYTTPIPITHDGMVVEHYASDGVVTESAKTDIFDRVKIAPMTAVTPEHGVLQPGVSGRETLLLTNDCPGHSTIYYTLDGSAPTTDSPIYSGPIVYSAGIDLRYMSVDEWGNAETPKRMTFVQAHKVYLRPGTGLIATDTPQAGDQPTSGSGGFYGDATLYSPQLVVYNTLIDSAPPVVNATASVTGRQATTQKGTVAVVTNGSKTVIVGSTLSNTQVGTTTTTAATTQQVSAGRIRDANGSVIRVFIWNGSNLVEITNTII